MACESKIIDYLERVRRSHVVEYKKHHRDQDADAAILIGDLIIDIRKLP